MKKIRRNIETKERTDIEICLIERKRVDVIKFISQNKQTTTKNDKE